MVVKLEISNFIVCRVLIDQRSSTNIIYWSTFKKFDIPTSQIKPFSEQLIGFLGETTYTMGHVNLLTTFRNEKCSKTIMIRYLLVKALISYNILIWWVHLINYGLLFQLPIKGWNSWVWVAGLSSLDMTKWLHENSMMQVLRFPWGRKWQSPKYN